MIDKVEKITRIKGAVYDVRRRKEKDGKEGRQGKFKRMLSSALEKDKKNAEKDDLALASQAYRLDVNRATQSLFYQGRQMLDLSELVKQIHA